MEHLSGALNQPPPLADYNLFLSDPALCEAVEREGAGWARDCLAAFGRLLGTEDVIRCGFEANEYPPVLRTHDRFGSRRDEVEFHPSWHSLMRMAVEHGLHSLPWRDPQPGAHAARAAFMMLAAQNEAGHLCPVSMTYSAVPALRKQPAIAREWEPRICSTAYDPRFRPASEKAGVLIGMGMTEKQGGSDVRANITRAEPVGAGSGEYRITGHKWFCSAPMCDAFLVLAQAPAGLSCFLLPRWTDGERNRFHLQRLKNKLGNRSNASSEVEFHGASAQLVGEEGRGVPAIMEMVQHTRLDCALTSAALMRQAVVQALHHARHRKAFGRLLIDQPLMRNVLADLLVESEAATLLAMRLARAFDSGERPFARLATAAGKYWVTKRAVAVTAEALECLGGNGYVEESVMPRLYRESPLNSIWEGSGNVICLDLLRTISKEPASVERVFEELRLGRGGDRRLDAFVDALEADLGDANEAHARRLAERIALALEASLLVRHGVPAMADAFISSRVAGECGRAFGTLAGADPGAILQRSGA